MPAPLAKDAHRTSRACADRIARTISRQGLTTPFLVFLIGHSPLSFAVGQLLYSIDPVARILNVSILGELATMLSEPQGIDLLRNALTQSDSDDSNRQHTVERSKFTSG